MSRASVLTLALVSAALLIDGVPVASPGAARGAASDASFGAEHIAAILYEVNPGLPEDERLRIGDAVLRSSERYGLDPELVTAVLIVESGARPWARSSKGAIGLMQVMPHMVEDMGIAGNLATIESNVEAGCFILADNIRRLGEEDGISAYFWGSNIRGVAYLDRVRQARAEVRRLSES